MYAEPTSMFVPIFDDTAREAVDRALAALRRGEPVAVTQCDSNGNQTSYITRSVEGVTDKAMRELRLLAGSEASLLITRRRATILGLASEGDGVVKLTAADRFTAELVQTITNPARAKDLPLPTGLTVELVEARPRSDILAFATQPDGVPLECAVVELARSARLLPAVLAIPLADQNVPDGLLQVRASDILNHRRQALRQLKIVADAQVPLDGAENSRIVGFRPHDGGPEHLAIIIGTPDAAAPVLTRLHSECFTGDLLGSLRCDCGPQLRGAIAEISRQGGGVVLYLAQEGRGIGLINKLRAYQIQDRGFDTVDANEMLGFESDERIYLPAAEMLRQLGYSQVRLLTNNPEKLRQLGQWGIEVTERVPHIFPANGHNAGYLRTKALRSGHMF